MAYLWALEKAEGGADMMLIGKERPIWKRVVNMYKGVFDRLACAK